MYISLIYFDPCNANTIGKLGNFADDISNAFNKLF